MHRFRDDGLLRLRAGGQEEAGEHFVPAAFGLAGTKAVAQEVELNESRVSCPT